MISAWERIENIVRNYPCISLRPGASPKEVELLAPEGFEVPTELKEMYLRHDMGGQEFFLMELVFLSASAVPGWHSLPEANLESLEDTKSFFDNPRDGISGDDYYSKRAALIPITAGSRQNLCVESRVDSESAEHGRVIWMDIESDHLLLAAPSISEYLKRCADDLEAGIYKCEDGLHVDHSYEYSTVEYCVNRWNR